MFRESCTYEIFRFLLHQYFLRVCTKLDRTSVGGDSTEFTKLTVFWTNFVPREMKTIVNICHHRNPHRSTPRVNRRIGCCRSTSNRGASLAPIRFPHDNLKNSLTLFSKSFSSFPCDTCLLSVSHPHLAMDGIYRPIRATFLNNPTCR